MDPICTICQDNMPDSSFLARELTAGLQAQFLSKGLVSQENDTCPDCRQVFFIVRLVNNAGR
jgi:hypothetical protein